MNPEIFTHYGRRLKRKKSRIYRKSLKAIAVSKRNVIASSNITIHYAKEIRLKAIIFYSNRKDINRFRKPTNYDY